MGGKEDVRKIGEKGTRGEMGGYVRGKKKQEEKQKRNERRK